MTRQLSQELRRYRKEKADRMMEALRKTITLNPHHANGLDALAWQHAAARQNLGEAKSLVERAMQIEPWNAYLIDTLAFVHAAAGDFKQALATHLRARELFPEYATDASRREFERRADEHAKVCAEKRPAADGPRVTP